MEHRALGKGLSALIPDKIFEPLGGETDKILYVRTEKIKENPNQPRINYDQSKLSDLVASIKEKGVLQPIIAREVEDYYEVIAGERRLRAARILNLEKIPILVKQVSSQEAFVLSLVENIQREELNPLEEAKAFLRLTEDFDLTHDEIALAIGRDRSTISNTLRLLKLPEEIQQSVFSQEISEGHARALLGVENLEEQKRLFAAVRQKGWSVRELERQIRARLDGTSRRKKEKSRDQDIVVLEEELQQIFGTRVRLKAARKRGKIVIEYYSPADLERILHLLRK